ncbi:MULTISPECIES: glycosyltransferase family 4 protein [unclassified Marinobacter]|jgi:phosphatidylinositol alpha-1,6-mannosyltransferase|uniref:glycosyltransferase family 4 protein n=1 Tax=unclassified Marinobacter TaxID=83889 RepID=UPI00200D6438|nr:MULTISPECIES: glycosyltransferase family 4 protein [unclassified Marinobacter]UQG54165.1 glycosyltransferase family 4 protein [Marinobacter sp. M4C]UQG62972.1 glycosyltransferase family 4 protein [Marinobacter sp. M2C]UQG67250.1 glycosyltransferase family 4 protein [Marinobacter sp. M1C]
MRKILLVSEIFPPTHGGSGRWFWEIYSRFAAGSVACLAGEHPNAKITDSGFPHPVYRFALNSPEWGLRSFSGLRFYLKVWNKLRKLVKSEGIAQIHCGRILPEGLAAMLIKLTHRVPYTCYVHGEDVEVALTSRELKLLTQLVMMRAERIVANSQNSRRILTEKWHLPEHKVVVMTPGVDVDKFTPARSSELLPKWAGKQVILTVGRLQKRKGQDMMIRALPTLAASVPNLHYCIVGDGDEREPLATLAAELGVSHMVEFAGEINDAEMVEHYRHCDLFALPNRRIGNDDEGFGMVLLEAQACGRPVLAGDAGGTRETLKVNQTGVIVDCTKPDTLAQGITKLFQDMDRLKSMGNEGRAHVEHKFSWDQLAQEAMQCLY